MESGWSEGVPGDTKAATEWLPESLIALINQSFGPLLQRLAPSSCVCTCEVIEENSHYKYRGKWCLANITSTIEHNHFLFKKLLCNLHCKSIPKDGVV